MRNTFRSPGPAELRQIRYDAGLTLQQAALLVHTTKKTWQKWEANESASSSRPIPVVIFEAFALKINGAPAATADRVRQARESAQLTVAEASKLVCCTMTTWRSWEQHQHPRGPMPGALFQHFQLINHQLPFHPTAICIAVKKQPHESDSLY